MRLTDEDKRILDGKRGEAARIALSVLVDLGELFGAAELMKVSQVHIDATLYMVEAGLEFAEKMVDMGGKVAVPTSLNPSAIDIQRWEAYRVPAETLSKHKRLEEAYLNMRAIPTWTCAPYQHGIIPRFGEQIAWGESNAIAFANSIIGARTNRYADLMDICAAIIGKVPKFGLHLTENRKAGMLIQLKDITGDMFADDAIYPLLGYILGEMAGDQVAAITGIPENVTTGNLKGFCAAAASSGAVEEALTRAREVGLATTRVQVEVRTDALGVDDESRLRVSRAHEVSIRIVPPVVPAERKPIRQPVIIDLDYGNIVALDHAEPILRRRWHANASLRTEVDLKGPQPLMANAGVERVDREVIPLGKYEQRPWLLRIGAKAPDRTIKPGVFHRFRRREQSAFGRGPQSDAPPV